MALAKVVLVSVFLVACHPDVAWTKNRGPTGMVSVVSTFSDVNMDGSYSYGYLASDGSYRNETRQVNGEVSGEYGYTDSFGLIRKVSYGAKKKSNFKFKSTSSIGGVNLIHPSLVEPMFPSASPQLHNSVLTSAEEQTKNSIKSNIKKKKKISIAKIILDKEKENAIKNIKEKEKYINDNKLPKEEMKISVKNRLEMEKQSGRKDNPIEKNRSSGKGNGPSSKSYDLEAKRVGGMRSLVGNKGRNQIIRKQITLLDNGKTFMAVRKPRKPTKKTPKKVMKKKILTQNPLFKRRQMKLKRKGRVLSKNSKATRQSNSRQNNFAENYQRFIKKQKQMRQRKSKLGRGRNARNNKSNKSSNGGRTIKINRNFSIQMPLRNPLSVQPRSS